MAHDLRFGADDSGRASFLRAIASPRRASRATGSNHHRRPPDGGCRDQEGRRRIADAKSRTSSSSRCGCARFRRRRSARARGRRHTSRRSRGSGLTNVRIDAAGNVLGERAGLAPRPHLVLSAHLDTVFPADTRGDADPVGIRAERARYRRRLSRPGGTARRRPRAQHRKGFRRRAASRSLGRSVRRGSGICAGVKHLFEPGARAQVDRFVSIDGAGLGITGTAVGSLRYRVTFKGPGGHSYGDFGVANPVHAARPRGRRIADLQVPREPRTTFNVGRVGGGTSVNSIASSAWMEVDLRSARSRRAQRARCRLPEGGRRRTCRRERRAGTIAAGSRSKRRWSAAVPAGANAADAPILSAAVSVTRALGRRTQCRRGVDRRQHPDESGDSRDHDRRGRRPRAGRTRRRRRSTRPSSWQGTARALLLAIALTGRVDPESTGGHRTGHRTNLVIARQIRLPESECRSTADRSRPAQMTLVAARRSAAGSGDLLLLAQKRFEAFQVLGALGRREGPGDADPVDENHVQHADEDQLESFRRRARPAGS